MKPKAVEMTDKLKKLILDAHNEDRNLIAGGKFPNSKLPTASRMMTYEWNKQLEYVAELNTKACKMEHDTKSMYVRV
jgi:hypothetical protein